MQNHSTHPLSIALAIFRLHPRGGLEDNCIRIAEELQARGHSVTVFVARDTPELTTNVVRITGIPHYFPNHRRMQLFARGLAKRIKSAGFDRTATFQTIPGFDFLFLADKIKNNVGTPWWKKLLPRFRIFAVLERAVFSPKSRTQVIGLSNEQMRPFRDLYNPDANRMRIAPPTLSRLKYRPESRNSDNKMAFRHAHGIPSDSDVWLALSLAPKTKGLDRTVEALSICQTAHLLIAGPAATDKSARKIRILAKQLKVEERVHWLGYLSGDTLLSAMAASDVLAHPARTEVTGAVILEAIINGLPVVATSHCGFAHHIIEAKAGEVIEEPISVEKYADTLRDVCRNGPKFSANGIAYGNSVILFDGVKTVCDWIEAGF